jgi:uncharacterized protein YutE (UPF0331/DUF86 family)
MAFIAQEYYEALKDAKLISKEDAAKIADLTKAAGLKKGKGYKAAQIRNVLFHSYTTIEEVVAIITNYYENKRSQIDQQKQFANSLKQQTQAV